MANEEFFKLISEMATHQQKAASQYENDCNSYWNSLSKDDQMMAFYSVCSRIHQGDIVEKGSYRHVLYNTFGFGFDSYLIGMECGYMDIHNEIFKSSNNPLDKNEIKEVPVEEIKPTTGATNPDLTPDTALGFLVDILSNAPIWQKDPNVKICCKMIGAKIIELQTKIDNAKAALEAQP